MYENVNYLMGYYGGGGGGSSSSSGINYSAEITALQTVAAKIPTFFTTTTLHGMLEKWQLGEIKYLLFLSYLIHQNNL
jgi:hypothetical protein